MRFSGWLNTQSAMLPVAGQARRWQWYFSPSTRYDTVAAFLGAFTL